TAANARRIKARLVIEGANTAKFIGNVKTGFTPVTVATGATYTMNDGNRFILDRTSTGFTVSGTGTLGVAAGGTGTITGIYTQDATATFRTHVTDATTFGKLLVADGFILSGSATLPASAKFDVVTGNAATCGGITAGTTLAGVISAATSLTAPSFATVTDDCTNINFTAVKNGNAVDLVASAPAPTTWAVTGANNGNGTVSCASPVANNGTATCTGTASGGYALASAAGSSTLCGTISVSGNTITAGPVTAACTVTGTFASTATYAVTATANPVAGGSVSCTPASGIASGGSSTCSGTANAGYTFTNWGGDCSSAGSTASCTLTNVTAAKSVTANFTAASTSQANLPTTANGVTANMSVSGCASISTAAFAAPAAGAPSNTTFPFGMLGFTLNGCISGPVAVTINYSQPLPSGATFYKNINGTYSAYPATLGANTVTFSLTDGGSGDADGQVNGSIRDPGGIGVPGSTAPIPTLSEWGLIFLSSLMAMFGIQHTRRRKGAQA
ncbi:MAG: IPTL-CTERM sorting domain-containing protein, partial [Rhodoferax sp.]